LIHLGICNLSQVFFFKFTFLPGEFALIQCRFTLIQSEFTLI